MPQLGHERRARDIFAKRHQVPLVVAADDPLGIVNKDRRLVDVVGPFGIATVDLATKQERAGRIGQRPQAPLRVARLGEDPFGIVERGKRFRVGAATAFGPADQVEGAIAAGARLPREPLQGVDRIVAAGVDLHERHLDCRCCCHLRRPESHRPYAVGKVGSADHHRRHTHRRPCRADCLVRGRPAAAEHLHQQHDHAGMGVEHEGGSFRAEQVYRLHEHGPGELAVAKLPGKDAHDEGLGRHGNQCGRQPGVA